jgi:glutathione reductase (NADPH)
LEESVMQKSFDLVVIGTGSAASAIAGRCRRAGWSVAVVDELPFGGTCALRGCDPKKVLVGNAEAIEWVRRLEGKGVRADALRIEWPELMRFKRSMIAGYSERKEEGFRRAGIETFRGRACFAGPNAIDVGGTELQAKKIAIASGAKPAPLGIAGQEHLTFSDQFLELDDLPRRVIFIGGGYISFELAHVAARAGASVTIVHRGRRPLPRFEPDLAMRVAEKSRAVGIDVRLGREVARIEKSDSGLAVVASHQGGEERVDGDLVVHGAGRVPAIDRLDLEQGCVEAVGWRLTLNEYLQSVSNPAVYAAGDAAAAGPPLTPVAAYEGRIVAANLLDGNGTKADYSAIPSVAFTIPPLAGVGLTEEAARGRGLNIRVNSGDTSGWYSSARIGETVSAYKVIVEEPAGRILGAHLIGPSAEETINLFALAMRAGVTSAQIKEMLFAYPTHASDMAYMV